MTSRTPSSIEVHRPVCRSTPVSANNGRRTSIPAFIAFNYFNASIRVLNTEMDNFSADFLNIVKRHFF